MDQIGATVEQTKVKESEMREMVRGVWEGSDLDTFRVLYHPIYQVEMLLKRKKRVVRTDGRTARELDF